jgi:hypothetical protein
MSAISYFFLRTKHWVLFLLMFIPFAASQIVVMIYIALGPASPQELFAKLTLVIFLASAASTLPFFFWLWATGSMLSQTQQASLKPNLEFFRFTIAFPCHTCACFF